MEEDSPTGAADDQSTEADSQATTESGTDQKVDNSQDTSSKSTDESAADDNDSTTDDEGDKAPATKIDSDIDEWAEKTGRPAPENDEDRARLQEDRDARRAYTREQDAKQSKKGAQDLKKDVDELRSKTGSEDDDDDLDPLEKRVNAQDAKFEAERTARLQSEYFSENAVTKEESDVMGDILKEKVERAEARGGKDAAKATLDYWTNPDNLEDWHDLAKLKLSKAGSSDGDKNAIEEKAREDERKRIAKQHQASGPNGNAKSVTSGKKTEAQERLERFSNWD